MPYTPRERRGWPTGLPPQPNSGDLAFAFARMIQRYRVEKGDSWQTFSDVFGALTGAKREFQRRVVDPYEDAKREQNGGIFTAPEGALTARRKVMDGEFAEPSGKLRLAPRSVFVDPAALQKRRDAEKPHIKIRADGACPLTDPEALAFEAEEATDFTRDYGEPRH